MVLLILSIIAIVLIVTYVRWKLNYWSRKKVPHNSSPIVDLRSFQLYTDAEYRAYKSGGARFYGVYKFLKPVLILIDPDMIKNVMIRDANHFNDRGLLANAKHDILANHLFNMTGTEWKTRRAKLTPVFTTGKMRLMFDVIRRCSEQLLDNVVGDEDRADILMKEYLARYTTDVIGSCAFGMEFNSLNEPNNDFRYYGRKLLKLDAAQQLKRLTINTFPTLARLFGIMAQSKEVVDFFCGFVRSMVEYREKNGYRRNDFMQLLIDMKNTHPPGHKDGITIEEITCECFLFFLAGFETSSSALTFALYELAGRKEIQAKARAEIESVLKKNDGKLTYDSLAEMKYCGQILDEALRKYPGGTTLMRRCIIDYKVPDSDLVIDKGTEIHIPLMSLHRDEEYFPEPERFDPDRFSDANKSNNVLYMPFGDGPRICIGLRFGLMQAKTGLVTLLRRYEFEVSNKTKPVRISRKDITMNSMDPIYFNLKKMC